MNRLTIRVGAVLVFAQSLLLSQYSPFVSPKVEQALVNELSGDRAWDNLRYLSVFHRTSGSEDFHKSALFIESRAKEYGLADVKLIRQKANSFGWSATSGEARVLEPVEMNLGSYADYAVALATNSRSTNVTAEIVDVGAGTAESDYAGKDVRGKIVLASAPPGGVMNEAVWKRGALGVISSYYNTFPRTSDMTDRPDQVAWTGIPYESSDGKPGTFGFMVSPRKGKALQDLLKQGPVKVAVRIEAAFATEKWQEYVEGWIRGTDSNQPAIVLTAHLQEEKPSYNDDGSGCVSILEIGRTLARLINEGRLPRPKRSLRFWWTTEISSEYQFFQDHPEERTRMLAALNQDMVAARQSMGSRIQHATRTPHSIPSYLSDVFENIVRYVEVGNTQFLAAAQAGAQQPYSKPILSHLGSRERFGVMVVPFFNNTDHMVFNEGVIGIPSVTLTNMPDDYIHSTDDDAHTADQTQIKRNAFITGATAWYLANATDTDVPTLASEVMQKGLARIADDARAAYAHIDRASDSQKSEAYRSARSAIQVAFTRESAAIATTTAFIDGNAYAKPFIENLRKQLQSRLGSTLDRVDEYFMATTNARSLPSTDLSAREKELDRKVPRNIGDLTEYFAKRGTIGPVPGLHALMRYEVFNFVDGKRSYYDIFRAVEAEAISAGPYYYGTVSLESVTILLDKAVEAGVLLLK